MQQRATTAYVPDKSLPQGVLDRIGYDEHGKLKFSPEHALFLDGPGQYPVTFFALGKYFRTPCTCSCCRPPAKPQAPARSCTTLLTSACPRTVPRASCRRARGSPASEYRKAGWAMSGTSTGTATTGRPSSVPLISAASASSGQYGLSARGIAVDVSTPGRRGRISRLHPLLLRAAGGRRQPRWSRSTRRWTVPA